MNEPNAAPGPMVQVHDVTKVYERGKQKVEALHRVDLDI